MVGVEDRMKRNASFLTVSTLRTAVMCHKIYRQVSPNKDYRSLEAGNWEEAEL